MRSLRYGINVTLDGCCDHTAGVPDEELHRFWADEIAQADALLFGRVTYGMMEEAWRRPADGVWPEWMDASDVEFAETIDVAEKYVVSTTLAQVDWNAELIRGDVGAAVQRLKDQPGGTVHVGGLTLPLALADLGLIDEYVFVVNPIVVGRGPTLFAGLQQPLDLELVDRRQLGSGATVQRYRPRRVAG